MPVLAPTSPTRRAGAWPIPARSRWAPALVASLLAGCAGAPSTPPAGPLPPPAIGAKPASPPPAASPAATAAPPTAAGPARPAPPARFTPLPSGTRLSYSRRDVGSFGQGESSLQVTVGNTTWQGRRAVSFSRAQGSIDLQEADTGRLMAVLGPDRKPQVTYDPPLGYELPLSIGKTWTARSTALTTATRLASAIEVRYTVQALEEVTVGAGTFQAWRLHQVDQTGDEQRVWVAVDSGLAVKRSFRRSATHPQGVGAREVELVSRTLPR